jgi:hypothetical protein
VVGAQLGLLPLERRLVQRDRPDRPAGGQVGIGQIGAARERELMIGAELGLAERGRLLMQGDGLGRPADGQVGGGQIDAAEE